MITICGTHMGPRAQTHTDRARRHVEKQCRHGGVHQKRCHPREAGEDSPSLRANGSRSHDALFSPAACTIIATERHESRRRRQPLAPRAARSWTPGDARQARRLLTLPRIPAAAHLRRPDRINRIMVHAEIARKARPIGHSDGDPPRSRRATQGRIAPTFDMRAALLESTMSANDSDEDHLPPHAQRAGSRVFARRGRPRIADCAFAAWVTEKSFLSANRPREVSRAMGYSGLEKWLKPAAQLHAPLRTWLENEPGP